MRYKYRVRLSYSLVFLLVGLLCGFALAQVNLGTDFSVTSYFAFWEKKTDSNENKVPKAIDSVKIGVILPQDKDSLKQAMNMAVLELQSNGEKVGIVYAKAGCSENVVKSAMEQLKQENVGAVYGIFCDESLNVAIESAEENSLPLLTLPPAQEMGLETGIIKIQSYETTNEKTKKFILAYNTFYKTGPSTDSAISYDVVSILNLMLNNKEIMDHQGILGTINIEKQGPSYLIIVE